MNIHAKTHNQNTSTLKVEKVKRPKYHNEDFDKRVKMGYCFKRGSLKISLVTLSEQGWCKCLSTTCSTLIDMFVYGSYVFLSIWYKKDVHRTTLISKTCTDKLHYLLLFSTKQKVFFIFFINKTWLVMNMVHVLHNVLTATTVIVHVMSRDMWQSKTKGQK